MRELKACSSKRFNEQSGKLTKFGWHDGYGAFTVGASTQQAVIRYIENQVQHHANEKFEEEYLRMRTAAGIQFD